MTVTVKMSVEVHTLGDLRRGVDLMENRGVDVETTGFTFSRRHGGSLIVIEPKDEDENVRRDLEALGYAR